MPAEGCDGGRYSAGCKRLNRSVGTVERAALGPRAGQGRDGAGSQVPDQERKANRSAPLPQAKVEAIRAELARGTGILKTARLCGTGVSAVQRIKRGLSPSEVPADGRG
jgi:hypothetical protein